MNYRQRTPCSHASPVRSGASNTCWCWYVCAETLINTYSLTTFPFVPPGSSYYRAIPGEVISSSDYETRQRAPLSRQSIHHQHRDSPVSSPSMETCVRTGDMHVALCDITRFPIYIKLKMTLEIGYIIPPNVDGFPRDGLHFRTLPVFYYLGPTEKTQP